MPEILNGIDLELYLDISSDTGETWVISIPGVVSGSRLNIEEALILEDENLNGILDPGEFGELYIYLHNSGTVAINGIIGQLSFIGPD